MCTHKRFVSGLLPAALACTLSAAMIAGCTASASETQDPKDLLATKCTLCHSTDRVYSVRYDEAAWRSTIDRMRGKGLQMTEAERDALAKYLSSR